MRGNFWNYGARCWQDDGQPLVRAKTRSFRKFSRKMDRRLAKLVERWAHAAAPSAIRPRRTLLVPVKPKPKPK